MDEVAEAVRTALAAHTPRFESVRLLLRPGGERDRQVVPVALRDELASLVVEEPDLGAYDEHTWGDR